MKKIITCFICLVLSSLFIFLIKDFYCNKNLEDNSFQENNTEKVVEVESYKDNGNTLYRYVLFDSEGNVVYQEDNIYNEPYIEKLEGGIVKLSIGAGTGVVLVRYYDSAKNIVSEVFETPWDEYNNKLIRFETKKMIIQDIFDKSGFYKEIEINTSESANPISMISSAKFLDNTTIEVTYLAGNDYKEVTKKIKY